MNNFTVIMAPKNDQGIIFFIRVNSSHGKAYQWHSKDGYVSQWISLSGASDDPIRGEGFWRKAGRNVNADIIEFLMCERLIKSSLQRHNCYKRTREWVMTNITPRENHSPISLPERARFKAYAELPDGSMQWKWCETESQAKAWCDRWH